MSSGKDTFDVYPTPAGMEIVKNRQKIALNGHKLLKRKVDALQMKFRKIAKDIINTKESLGDMFKTGYIMLAEAKYVYPDFKQAVLGGVGKAHFKVEHNLEHIVGVPITTFKCVNAGDDYYELTGLAQGGSKIMDLKEEYMSVTEQLVRLASLQMTFRNLDEAIKSVNRRVNSLEHVYIPKCEVTIKYIKDEMEENQRQDFFRMKMVQRMKKSLDEKTGGGDAAGEKKKKEKAKKAAKKDQKRWCLKDCCRTESGESIREGGVSRGVQEMKVAGRSESKWFREDKGTNREKSKSQSGKTGQKEEQPESESQIVEQEE